MAYAYNYTDLSTWASGDTSSVTDNLTYTGTNDVAYGYGGDVQQDNAIEVKKGSPGKARYAIFYAVEKDPVYFVGSLKEVKKIIKRLKKDKTVDNNSIRVFKLMSPKGLI